MARWTEAGRAFTDLILEVFRLNGLLLEAGDRLAAPSGLTSARWQVLGVADHGPVTVAQVARTMGLRRQSVQQTADALARDGFVVFVDDPDDRRARRIALTAAGRRALRAVEARHALWVEALAARVDLRALRATVAALRDANVLLQSPPPRGPRRRRKD
ncbi:DNA-binding transcriptional regulator, MarR family [Nannocystis exedens]|uniref:DNA-binding transcriptional regulator, MarR family n=1 Tax=Nannocystis exedens TaxID=54 RepID=A0A1I2F6E1_9BACT|nr:MarR family winged helix-turn-helix transcriptional regulator [Nannocystis exedens]PCC73045.1 MarR family transcriptional regulator [Nannocystis exedens]SFF01014.1 DNA-binding transcriptional regulator, MarR family [Nannocystis exedens]